MDEFKDKDWKLVVPLIDGAPEIGVASIEPGLTNKEYDSGGQRIIGLNTEDGELHEGLVWYDILFHVRNMDELLKIILNLEMQKNNPSGISGATKIFLNAKGDG